MYALACMFGWCVRMCVLCAGVSVCVCMFVCVCVRAGIDGIQRYTKYTLIRFFEKYYALLLASLILEVLDSLSADRFM